VPTNEGKKTRIWFKKIQNETPKNVLIQYGRLKEIKKDPKKRQKMKSHLHTSIQVYVEHEEKSEREPNKLNCELPGNLTYKRKETLRNTKEGSKNHR